MDFPPSFLPSPTLLLAPADTATSTITDYNIFQDLGSLHDTMMELLGSYAINMPDAGPALSEPFEDVIAPAQLATVDKKDRLTDIASKDDPSSAGSLPPALNASKPTKRIPSITFPAAAFYIDPQLCLPTPVDDKYPLFVGTDTYMLPQGMIDPTLSLPTPTKDKDESIERRPSPQIVVDPALDSSSRSALVDGRSASVVMPGTTSMSVSMLQLDEATSAMSRGSSDSSSSASTVVGDHTIPYIALPKSSTSSPFLSVIPPTNPSRPETALNAPNASSPLPAGFPAHLPLSYPARTGVAVLNTKSKPVGWDCGPATISLFEAKYGPGANGPLTRDVQPGISGGVSKPSINWRLYGDGRLGAESAREQTEPEAAERGLPRAPSPPPTRRIAQLKSSSSNRRASVKDEPTVEQARAIWMQYYAAVEEFRTLRLPSVMGPWEPACRCPFAEEGGE